jgi:hypothetical protein
MTHENYDRTEEVKTSSNRSFGFVMAAAAVAFGLFPLVAGGSPHWWLLCLGGLFLLAAFAKPALLGPLNFLWTRFGLLLSRITNPLILGLMYYLVMTPVALVMKLVGHDPLQRKFDPDKETYWQEKQPVGPAPESMRNQF